MRLARFLLSVVFGLLPATLVEARITVIPTNGGTYELVNFGGTTYGLTLTASESDGADPDRFAPRG